MKKIALALISLLLATSALAGVTWTEAEDRTPLRKVCTVFTATIVSAADGTASGATSMHGYVVRVTTVPDGGGTQPSAYSCTLADASGVDVLGGALATRSTTAAQQAFPLTPNSTEFPVRLTGTVTLSCTGMGNAKGATVRFYVE